jgi:hypothetical protein
MRNLVLISLMMTLVSGCAMVEANRVSTADMQGKFHVGMSLEEVVSIVGRQPGAMRDVYTVTTLADGVHKTWKISGTGAKAGNIFRFYEFNFVNDKLVSWSWHQ